MEGLFVQHPPPQVACTRWSLHCVLVWLAALNTDGHLTMMDAFRKALFLITLASGLRISQLESLTRFPAWTVFWPLLELVSLAPSPTHLAKIEGEDHCLPLVIVPSFMDGGSLYSLCLVWALYDYSQLTDTPSPSLFTLCLAGVS